MPYVLTSGTVGNGLLFLANRNNNYTHVYTSDPKLAMVINDLEEAKKLSYQKFLAYKFQIIDHEDKYSEYASEIWDSSILKCESYAHTVTLNLIEESDLPIELKKPIWIKHEAR